jgi:hypothetical protein
LEIIKKNDTLKEIDFSNNKMDEEVSEFTFDYLENDNVIEKLNLQGTKINPKYLSNCLAYNSTLKEVIFDYNEVEIFQKTLEKVLKYYNYSIQILCPLDIDCLVPYLKRNTKRTQSYFLLFLINDINFIYLNK